MEQQDVVAAVWAALEDFAIHKNLDHLSKAEKLIAALPAGEQAKELQGELYRVAREEANYWLEVVGSEHKEEPTDPLQACSNLERCLKILGDDTAFCAALRENIININILEGAVEEYAEGDTSHAAQLLAKRGASDMVLAEGQAGLWTEVERTRQAIKHIVDNQSVAGVLP